MLVGQDGIDHPFAMQIGAGDGVESMAQQSAGFPLDFASVGAGKRSQVELE